MRIVLGLALVLVAAAQTGDPLAGTRRAQGKTAVECSGTLETIMLLAQLAARSPARSDFQTQTQTHFALRASHPAVRETAALMERGFDYTDFARFSTFLSQAPYFTLNDSDELKELAARLPGGNLDFSLDRLYGYSKLVRDFYWDNHVGRYLRSALSNYQQALRRPLPAELPQGAKVIYSALAPVDRIEFERRTPRSMTYIILGEPAKAGE